MTPLLSMHITPFHADPHLQGLVSAVFDQKIVKTFVETGTYRGATLRWVASHFPDVRCYSCEVDRACYVWSSFLTRKQKNISIALSSSPPFLADLAFAPPKALWWLDAHGEDGWPLLDEIETIKDKGYRGIIIVDDFKVGIDGFQYLTLKGQECDEAYLRKAVGDNQIWVPDYPAPNRHVAGYAIIPWEVDLPSDLFQGFRKL